jgi:hypothetical protein
MVRNLGTPRSLLQCIIRLQRGGGLRAGERRLLSWRLHGQACNPCLVTLSHNTRHVCSWLSTPCAQPLYPANATCVDVDGAGLDNDTFSSCGAGKQYDASKGNATIAGLVVSGTLAVEACCSVSLGCFELDSEPFTELNQCIQTILTLTQTRMFRSVQAIYPLGATCGNTTMTDVTAVFPSASCLKGREYNASRSSVSIEGDFTAQAAAKCCVYAAGSTCGDVGGSPFPSAECPAGTSYNATLSPTSIADDVQAQAGLKCCSPA